jgi:protein gp37
MNETAISWTKYTNNPIRFRRVSDGKVGWHCEKASDGCKHCYAETLNLKWGTGIKFTVAGTGEMECFFDVKMIAKLYTTLKEPSKVFMFDMTDLFGDFIPDLYRAASFCVMLDLPQHTFQLLTKRAAATVDWHTRFVETVQSEAFKSFRETVENKYVRAALDKAESYASPWASHIWMGTSVEDSRVLQRIDDLRRSGAHVRFISAEPLIGAWGEVDLTGIHWVIVGGESGQHLTGPEHPRWMKQEWAREVKRQCLDQGVAFFYKQDSGARTEMRTYLVEPDGSKWKWEQWPNDLLPPRRLGFDEKPIYSDTTGYVSGMGFDECLSRAQEYERLAHALVRFHPSEQTWYMEASALEAAYWYKAAWELRAQSPADIPPAPPVAAPEEALVEVTAAPQSPPSPAPEASKKELKVGDHVTVKGNPVVGTIVEVGRPNHMEGKVCVTRRNPGAKTNVTHWVKVENVTLVEQTKPAQEDSEAEWVQQVNKEAHRLDQMYEDNVPRQRANAVAAGLPPEAGETITAGYMRPEMDAFVNLASGGTHPTIDSLLNAVKPVTRVVNFRDLSDKWNASTCDWGDPSYVYIGRASVHYGLKESPFANPFKIASDTPANRAEAIAKYREWIATQPALLQQLESLRGKKLVCWCTPKDCHGHVLLDLLGEVGKAPDIIRDKTPAPAPVNERDTKQDKPAEIPQPSLFGDDTLTSLERTHQLALLF